MEHEYCTYIMASVTGTLYIGVTGRLEVRVQQHKVREIEGFAAKYKCTRLVYYERYGEVGLAIGREKQLKVWSRSKKIALIESVNPRWKDLSENWGREMLFRNQRMDEAH
jgi:putative endonuclease